MVSPAPIIRPPKRLLARRAHEENDIHMDIELVLGYVRRPPPLGEPHPRIRENLSVRGFQPPLRGLTRRGSQ